MVILDYFTVIWNILWPFGNIAVIWFYFPSFWFIVSINIWQPARYFQIMLTQRQKMRQNVVVISVIFFVTADQIKLPQKRQKV
jgi:hypothetical protein